MDARLIDRPKDHSLTQWSTPLASFGTLYGIDQSVPRSVLMVLTNTTRTMSYYRAREGHPSFDPTYPKPIRQGANKPGFLLSEIKAWLEAKTAERDAKDVNPVRMKTMNSRPVPKAGAK